MTNMHTPLFEAIERITTPAKQPEIRDAQRRMLEREESQGLLLAMDEIVQALHYPSISQKRYAEAIACLQRAWAARNLLDPDDCELEPCALAEWITRAKNAEGERDALRLRVKHLEQYEPESEDEE